MHALIVMHQFLVFIQNESADLDALLEAVFHLLRLKSQRLQSFGRVITQLLQLVDEGRLQHLNCVMHLLLEKQEITIGHL